MAEITSWKLMEVNDKINGWYEITHKVMKPSMSSWHRSYLVVRWRFWFFKHEVPWVTSPCIITLWNPSRNTINWTKNFENKENKYFVKFFFYSKLLKQSMILNQSFELTWDMHAPKTTKYGLHFSLHHFHVFLHVTETLWENDI